MAHQDEYDVVSVRPSEIQTGDWIAKREPSGNVTTFQVHSVTMQMAGNETRWVVESAPENGKAIRITYLDQHYVSKIVRR